MPKHRAEFERKPIEDGAFFESLRGLHPSPQQLKIIDEVEKSMSSHKDSRRSIVAQMIENICYDFDAGGWASKEQWDGYTDQMIRVIDATLFPEDLTEQIRRVLSKGAYIQYLGDLPYEAQARNVVALLKGIHE